MSTTGAFSYHLAKHLAGLLVCHTGNSLQHIKNLKDFAQTLGSLHAGPKGTMVSFDVVSLFTRMPIREIMSLLSWYFEEHILRLFCHVLTASYFSSMNKLTAWLWVHHCLWPLPTSSWRTLRRSCSTRLPISPLLILLHGRHVCHLATWTREAEGLPWPPEHCPLEHLGHHRDSHLPFLDTDIYRRPNDSLSHKVYHKPTHTNHLRKPPSWQQIWILRRVMQVHAHCPYQGTQ